MPFYAARPYKILFAVSVVIPVMLFSFMMWQDYNSILKEHKIEAVRTAKIFQQHALNVFETHQLVAERIDERLKGMTWDQIERSSELRSYLKKIEKDYPQVQAIWLADRSGIIRNASKALPAAPVNISERDYFQALSRKNTGLFIGHIIKPHVMTNLNFNVAYRRNNSSEQFDGVVIVTVFPEYFGTFWNQTANTQNSATLIIRSDGAVLARSLGIDPERLFLPPDSEPMRKIQNVREGSYIAPSVHDGTRRIYGFHKLDKYNVYLFHGIKMESVVQEWRQHLVYYGTLFGIAMIILVLLILSAQRHSKNDHSVQEDMRRLNDDLHASREKSDNERRLLAAVMESLPVGVAITDFRGGTVRSNSAFEQVWGGPRPATLSFDDYGNYSGWWYDTGKPVEPGEWASAAAVRTGGTVAGQILRIQRFDGSEAFVINSASPVYDADGNISGCAVAIQDITALKRTEMALRESEFFFKESQRAASIGSYKTDFVTDKWESSEVLDDIFGIDGNYPRSIQGWLDLVHPGDRDLMDRYLREEVVSKKTIFSREYRIIRKNDGETRWVLGLGEVKVDANGIPLSLTGTIQDVTERKRAENLLRESGERLRFHMENSPMAVIEWDKNYIVRSWTGEAERMFGWSTEETVGKPLADLKMVFDDDLPAVKKNIAQLTDGAAQHHITTNRNLTKNGEVRYCTWYSSVLTDQDGRMSSVLSKVIDITAQKQAEEALHLVHEQLELRVAERTEQLEAIVEILLEEMAGRERTEISLQRLNRIYNVLSETNQTIVRATSRDSLFCDFCRIAVVHGGFLLSWVGLLDNETGQIRRVAAYGATGYLDEIQISSNDEPLGLGPTGRSVRDGTYHICNDFQNDPCTRPWHEQGEAYGICSSASIALKEDGKVIGSLTLYAGEKDFFDQQHEELLRQMGEDVSFAIDHLTQEEHRRITEQALRNETLERLRTVEALRKQELLLIQQNRHAAMGEMIGNIAHQWRQPLNTLGLLTQRLGFLYETPRFSKEFLESSVAKSMEIIQYMSRTIDDFRNFFSTDREKTEFSIDEALDKAISLVEASFKENGIGFERGGVENVKIFGFLNEYAQVLINIFINAKDALKERNVEFPIIKIVIGCENGTSVVTITDNAGGIQEEIMEKIFDPYFSTKGPQQGTGIGLFMSKTIIENNMDGRLSVCNTDEGAEFRIEV